MHISCSLCFRVMPVAFALATGVQNGAEARSWPAPFPRNENFRGVVHVIDGDTIDVSGTRVRLEGIDAPESAQTCKTAAGADWPCGTEATRAMRQMVEGKEAVCRNHGMDLYGRTLATCYLGLISINRQMVVIGLAWAYVKYSTSYVAEEAAARKAGLGIWQGPAVPAWDYRAAAWSGAADQAPQGCAIKGNVTPNGRIYHMPWSPWYNKVRIDGHPEKRWFCSEAEAVAAGWRPAFAHHTQ